MVPSEERVEPISVAIIDDNRLVREGLTAMLDRLDDVQAVAVASSDQLGALQPNVILLDVGLRDQESLRVAIALRKSAPGAMIVIMDVMPVNEEIVEFVNIGVAGFVLKDATLDELVSTIRAVAVGQKVLPARMTESLFAQIAKEAESRLEERALDEVRMTPREREVIDLIAEGLSNKEIAQRLNIATHTVKTHVRNVMEKLELHTRLQIAAYSRREEPASGLEYGKER